MTRLRFCSLIAVPRGATDLQANRACGHARGKASSGKDAHGEGTVLQFKHEERAGLGTPDQQTVCVILQPSINVALCFSLVATQRVPLPGVMFLLFL